MRIGVNVRLLLANRMDGIGWYAYETVRRMVAAHPEVEFVFFFDRKPDPDFIFGANVKPVVVRPQARHPLLWMLFFEWGIRRALGKEKIDVFFSPDGWLCLGTGVKTLAVVHDLNFVHHPDFVSPLLGRYYNFFFPRFARRADALATVSEFSKQDIMRTYQLPSQKITVAYSAAKDDFFEIPEQEKEATRNRYTAGVPYFLFVGTGHKRKNIVRILEAFDRFKHNGHTHKLVFAGSGKYWEKEMIRQWQEMRYGEDVVFTGYVSTEDVNRLISSATALVYATLFEGFGTPVLEAFACGTPVITSNLTAMPEIAAEAALKVNPYDAASISLAMEDIVSSAVLRQQLVERGRERLRDFSWDKTAKILWKCIEELV
jgi:glycosyltransferase involved in cell wall biosynthesis